MQIFRGRDGGGRGGRGEGGGLGPVGIFVLPRSITRSSFPLFYRPFSPFPFSLHWLSLFLSLPLSLPRPLFLSISPLSGPVTGRALAQCSARPLARAARPVPDTRTRTPSIPSCVGAYRAPSCFRAVRGEAHVQGEAPPNLALVTNQCPPTPVGDHSSPHRQLMSGDRHKRLESLYPCGDHSFIYPCGDHL